MSNIIENLQKAFDVPLIQFGVDNSIAVALENIDAPTSSDTPYIAGFLLDQDINESDLGVTESISSIYQIDVNYSSHVGSSDINEMIDLLRVKFHTGSTHTFKGDCFGVDNMTVTRLPVNNGWAQKSISLNITGYTPRL